MAYYRDVWLLPIERGNNKLYTASLVDSEFNAIEDSLLVRGKKAYQEGYVSGISNVSATIESSLFFGGIIFLHYGHFITESLSRLYAWDPIKYDKIIFSVVGPAKHFSELPQWIVNLLSIYGINESNLVLLNVNTKCDSVYCVKPGFTLNGWFDKKHINYLADKLKDNKAKLRDTSFDKVFISRSRFSKGNVAGESYLDKVFSDNGFYILHPQNHDIFYQLSVLRNARVIAGISGSAFHTVMLLDKKPEKIFEICRRGKINGTQKIINDALGIGTKNLNYIVDENTSTSGSAIKIKLNECLDDLKSLGVIEDFMAIDDELLNTEYELLQRYEHLSIIINKYNSKHLANILADDDVNLLESLIENFPQLPGPFFHLAKVKFGLGDYKSSLKLARKAVNLCPKNVTYWGFLCELYKKLGDKLNFSKTKTKLDSLRDKV
ncbi:glycosyltransferase 61 family protein [Pseudoalteromonas carrageenovora]|uniref:glycosyltransferase 61 family protein n=1 Tax=Pseudoalteromonas carrageenovora TaxID=227 RepID=UPI0026E24AC2|nr:glycosyltransferase 61 family protein [Pseudoalteromonas carrageenovora]MDO6548898.1 glycosyltransferase 61 family protein [Pseudoalteromonas carrageenovora]MDO6833403.1 glycosyltransferase 61 family protein [Pseudoalteromonas carrageenovora]